MSVLDKGTLCFIWGISLFYTCLTEQLKISDSCSVRENINEKYYMVPMIFLIILPIIIGPVLVTIIHIIISIFNTMMGNAPVSSDIRIQEQQNIFCTFLLTTTFLITYIISMVICEFFMSPIFNLFSFVILKYIIGTSYHIFGPICILLSKRGKRLKLGLKRLLFFIPSLLLKKDSMAICIRNYLYESILCNILLLILKYISSYSISNIVPIIDGYVNCYSKQHHDLRRL